jgi:hypothetical protein
MTSSREGNDGEALPPFCVECGKPEGYPHHRSWWRQRAGYHPFALPPSDSAAGGASEPQQQGEGWTKKGQQQEPPTSEKVR